MQVQLKEDVIRRLACADTWPCFFKRAQASTNGDGVFATDEVEIVQGQPSVRLDIAEGVSLKDVKSFLVAALEWIRNQIRRQSLLIKLDWWTTYRKTFNSDYVIITGG